MKNTLFYAANRHKYNFQTDFTKKHIKEDRYINGQEIPQILKDYTVLIVLVICTILINTNYMTWFAEKNIPYKRLIKMFDG